MPDTTSLATWVDRIVLILSSTPIGEAVVRGTLLLIVAFVLAWALRSAPAATRHLLWAVTLLGLLLLPPVTWLGPDLALPLLLPEEPPSARIVGPVHETNPLDPSPVAGDGTDTLGATPRVDTKHRIADEPRSAGAALPWFARLWILGVLAVLVPTLAALLRVRALHRRDRSGTTHPSRHPDLTPIARALRITRPVQLSYSRDTQVPMTWGLARPEVLLPDAADHWPRRLRRDVLTHELAHIARGDWGWHLLARLVCALYWFHPLAWLAARQLALEAERACDDRALLLGSRRTDYAANLLTLARDAVWPATPGPALAMSRKHQLHTRLTALLDTHQRRTPMKRAHACAAFAGALLMIATLATSHLVAAPAYDENARPLIEAAAQGDIEAVRRVLGEGTDPDTALPGRGTALIRAAGQGHRDVVALLLDRGADPNRTETAKAPRRWQRSPLGAASRFGDRTIAAALLDAGADVELTPRGDASPLIIAAREGHAPVVELLLDEGADPNRAVRGDGAPLIAASAGGHGTVVALLLDRGARPDVFVRGDGTPLVQAVASGDIALVGQLLEAGADPNKRARGDGSPLLQAAARGEQAIVDLLIAHGATVDRATEGDGNALIRAAARGDQAMVVRLLDAGADPDAAVRGDGSPLIAAAARGHVEIVSLLLDRDASIDQVVPGDETALIQAAWKGRREVVELLLDRGADVNLSVRAERWRAGSEVRSPLSQAERGGHDAIVELLRSHGAES